MATCKFSFTLNWENSYSMVDIINAERRARLGGMRQQILRLFSSQLPRNAAAFYRHIAHSAIVHGDFTDPATPQEACTLTAGQLSMNIPQNLPGAVKLIYRMHAYHRIDASPCEIADVRSLYIDAGDVGM